MEKVIEIKRILKEDESIKHLLELQSIYTMLKSINKILLRESCKHTLIDNKFIDKFGLERASLLSDVLQMFYEIGLKEGKEKL